MIAAAANAARWSTRRPRPAPRRTAREPRRRESRGASAPRRPGDPERIEARDLDKGARAELKTLSKDNADWVARHLVAASELLEDDPELAHRHAMSGRSPRRPRRGRPRDARDHRLRDGRLRARAARAAHLPPDLGQQRPAAAHGRQRARRRPSRPRARGGPLGRPRRAARGRAGGLAIAMSGARLDLGQPELALAELEIPQLDPDRAFSYSPALFSAYAEVLEELGRDSEAAAGAPEPTAPRRRSRSRGVRARRDLRGRARGGADEDEREPRRAPSSGIRGAEPAASDARRRDRRPTTRCGPRGDRGSARRGRGLERRRRATRPPTTDEDGADGPVPHED